MKIKKGIYILPSLFTIANLAAGFKSILYSFQGNVEFAAWAILVAIGFDVFDGRIARITKTTTRFGIEFDSLADLVSFGLAPAFMVYVMILHTYKWGSVVAFLFVLAGALRLARFNANASDYYPQTFDGLPIPAAAGTLVALVVTRTFFCTYIENNFIKILLVLMIIISYLMLSNITYTKFKFLTLTKRRSMEFLIFVVVLGVLTWKYPKHMVFVIFFAYVLTGILSLIFRMYAIRRRRHKDKKNSFKDKGK